jgi:succinyl-CoA synthetase alpha subunit
MGHDGAFQSRGENTATAKARKLSKAGVVIADHPSYVGEEMKKLLQTSGRASMACSTAG